MGNSGQWGEKKRNDEKPERACAVRGRPASSMLPEAMRVWELNRMSIAAWVTAGTVGYFLCALPAAPGAERVRLM